MTRLRFAGMVVALAVWVAGTGGCATEGLPDETALPDQSGSNETTDPDTTAGAETGNQARSVLGELATGMSAIDGGSDLAYSEGYESISTSGYITPRTWFPPGSNPYSSDGSGGTTWRDYVDGISGGGGGDGSDGSDRPDSTDGGGSALTGGGGPCSPESGWHDWPGEFNGSVDCQESESLSGYGEGGKGMTFCFSMSFDDAGAPRWIPIPVFAGVEVEVLQVNLRFPGDSGEFPAGMYDVVATVLSATYTPTTASVTLELDQQWIGEYSSIKARGTHTLHTEVVGDTLVYSSQTSYDGRFWAEADDDDWEANATQDFDCSARLTAP